MTYLVVCSLLCYGSIAWSVERIALWFSREEIRTAHALGQQVLRVRGVHGATLSVMGALVAASFGLHYIGFMSDINAFSNDVVHVPDVYDAVEAFGASLIGIVWPVIAAYALFITSLWYAYCAVWIEFTQSIHTQTESEGVDGMRPRLVLVTTKDIPSR